MKKLRAIDFNVIPLDNDGYLVNAMVDVREKQSEATQEAPGDTLMRMFAGQLSQGTRNEPIRFYAPDSYQVGSKIVEIINQANIQAMVNKAGGDSK